MVEKIMIAFGPVPSRRLGQSLGINNIPPKICTYSCTYCQLGRTIKMQANREEFYKPGEVAGDVKAKIEQLQGKAEPVDYLTFVPDGEPTLDMNIDREIEFLKSVGIKIAVITNASLIWDADVREALSKDDWVSLKVDAVSENIWRKVDRPYRSLKLEMILDGMLNFATGFGGTLVTETMLIQEVNDGKDEVERIADFLTKLSPGASYVSIPTRPPAEKWVKPAVESSINMAYQIFINRGLNAEYLIGYEGNAFASTGDAAADILSITSVHPMREEGVEELLAKSNSRWEIVYKLLDERKLMELEYEGNRFYMRKLPGEYRRGSEKCKAYR
jgi:wyosine [tRNA(Phe)-imidazoG37] synthetase (radical SAM superfamily)